MVTSCHVKRSDEVEGKMNQEKYTRLKEFFTSEANPNKVVDRFHMHEIYMGRKHYRYDKNERSVLDRNLMSAQLSRLLFRLHQPPTNEADEIILKNSFRYACLQNKHLNPLFITASALAAALSKEGADNLANDLPFMRRMKRAFDMATDYSWHEKRGLMKRRIDEYAVPYKQAKNSAFLPAAI
jgi:hypothetical protein